MSVQRQWSLKNQLKILKVLSEHDKLSFMEIVEKTDLSTHTVSKHLKRLRARKEVSVNKKKLFTKRNFRITEKGLVRINH